MAKKKYDTPKCKKCKGRTALIKGYWHTEPDAEPYTIGVEEKALVESGEDYVLGYKCDSCGHIQGMWHE